MPTTMPRNTKTIGISIAIIGLLLLLILGFVKSNVDIQEKYLCTITHADPNLDIKACPAHDSNNSWYLLVAFGVSFIALGLGLYLILADRSAAAVTSSPASGRKEETDKTNNHAEKSDTSDVQNIDLSKLDDDEKKIYEIITAHEGSRYQSDIIRASEFSKVKVTRVL